MLFYTSIRSTLLLCIYILPSKMADFFIFAILTAIVTSCAKPLYAPTTTHYVCIIYNIMYVYTPQKLAWKTTEQS